MRELISAKSMYNVVVIVFIANNNKNMSPICLHKFEISVGFCIFDESLICLGDDAGRRPPVLDAALLL